MIVDTCFDTRAKKKKVFSTQNRICFSFFLKKNKKQPEHSASTGKKSVNTSQPISNNVLICADIVLF